MTQPQYSAGSSSMRAPNARAQPKRPSPPSAVSAARPSASLESKGAVARWKTRNKARANAHSAKYALKIRVAVLNYYSNGAPRCACCGETRLDFLSIDHVAGDGATHRKTVKSGYLAYWLVRNGFPPGFQILCFNCNRSKAFPRNKGRCAHELEREALR